jgi:hypothetical protein
MTECNVGWYGGVGFELGEEGTRLIPGGSPNRRQCDPRIPRDGEHAFDPTAECALRLREDPLLVGDPSYARKRSHYDLWPAGHAHAGVLLDLSLVELPCVEVARLSNEAKRVMQRSIPASILLPLAFFLLVFSHGTTEPNATIYLAYSGAVSLAASLLVPGNGLTCGSLRSKEGHRRGVA